MNSVCLECNKNFLIRKEEIEFIKKVSPVLDSISYQLPLPKLCPNCRQKSRLAFRNEFSFYKRKCDFSGKNLISVYSPDSTYQVYDQNVWWSDQYDPLSYGQPFDFSKTFFEQFAELNLRVPKVAIQNSKSENSEYTNYSSENKNCYMVVGGLGAEDCYYSYRIFYSKDSVDCFDVYKCELCKDCIQSENLYSCLNCEYCQNSSNLTLCAYCYSCRDCFGCVNLHNSQYCIYNQQLSKEEYHLQIKSLREDFLNLSKQKEIFTQFHNFYFQQAKRGSLITNCENSFGDMLFNCKNSFAAYSLKNSEDCAYCYLGDGNKDCFDANCFDNSELQYFSTNLEKNYRVIFSFLVWYSQEVSYSVNSFYSKNLFGCSGMKKQQYCILNKQYSKEEYQKLLPKIIAHLQETKEWGNFFPAHISPFAYNETLANQLHPLTEEEAKKSCYKWKDKNSDEYLITSAIIPDTIAQTKDEIVNELFSCEKCSRNYRITKAELNLYRKLQTPAPKKCFFCRHDQRINQTRPLSIAETECSQCQVTFNSVLANKENIILCEECYRKNFFN